MLRHVGCADVDVGVASYVRQQREALMAGMPPQGELPNHLTTEDDLLNLDFLKDEDKDGLHEEDDEIIEEDDEIIEEDDEADNEKDELGATPASPLKPSKLGGPPPTPRWTSSSLPGLMEDTSEVGIAHRLRNRRR